MSWVIIGIFIILVACFFLLFGAKALIEECQDHYKNWFAIFGYIIVILCSILLFVLGASAIGMIFGG